jgi:pilus assembly protein Flp/PilA
MRDFFKKFRKSEDGATLVEYGVALILAIVVGGGALIALSDEVVENMEDTAGLAAFTYVPPAAP